MQKRCLPENYLDRAIVRIAVTHAAKLLLHGEMPEEAVRRACPGAWEGLRLHVRDQLRERYLAASEAAYLRPEDRIKRTGPIGHAWRLSIMTARDGLSSRNPR